MAGEFESPSARGHDFLSPHTGKRRASYLPTPMGLNDDAQERKERRRSKVMELQRKHLSSPATPTERRQNLQQQSLTNAQIGEIYTNCIKLSAENKISAKNAFGLHLIDYMSELLAKKDMNNFQVASSTLDASAKIYAGRVDAIHSETYKVLSGLGRGANKQNADGEDIPEGEDDGAGGEGPKPKKRMRKSNIIEANLKNINLKKVEMDFEVDPMFQQTSAAFDEGGSGGLLLNHLRCLNDSSSLVLDSNTMVSSLDDPLTNSQAIRAKKMIDLSELKSIYTGINLDLLRICPQFDDFEFMNWSRERNDAFSQTLLSQKSVSNDMHAFDLDAEAEPIPETFNTSMAGPGGDFTIQDDFGVGGDDDDDNNDAVSETGSVRNLCLSDGKEAVMVKHGVDEIKHGTVGTLMQLLADEPSDYSFFNASLLSTWAGPEHWKLKGKAKVNPLLTIQETTSKVKKEALVIDYEEEKDFEQDFRETRASTMITRSTLEKYKKSQTTLPENLRYSTDRLFQLFKKPKVMIKRQKREAADMEDNIESYDFDNANDKDNFCPPNDNDDDDDNEPGVGFNFTRDSQGDMFNASVDSQGSFIDVTADGTVLTGDNLVAQPKKVEKIEIGYAKTAKKIDVKRLKSSMWKLLSIPEDEKENQTENVIEEPPATSVNGTHTFTHLVQDLPQKVSKNMAKNLTVPIAFVCLLHLANEKTLKICSDEDMSELKIEQG